MFRVELENLLGAVALAQRMEVRGIEWIGFRIAVAIRDQGHHGCGAIPVIPLAGLTHAYQFSEGQWAWVQA